VFLWPIGGREEYRMSSLGWGEIVIVIVVIAALFLVPKKLPQLGSSMGKSIRSFKKGLQEGKKEVRDAAGLTDVKSAVAEVRDATQVKEIKASAKELRDSISLKDALKDTPGSNGSSSTPAVTDKTE
jgi:sec-independent protein translocase protein TatA